LLSEFPHFDLAIFPKYNMNDNKRLLGSIIQGSLSEGLEVRLEADISVEDMRVGKFLVVQGMRSPFAALRDPAGIRGAVRAFSVLSPMSISLLPGGKSSKSFINYQLSINNYQLSI